MTLGTASPTAINTFFSNLSAANSYASIYSALPTTANSNQITGITRQAITWSALSGNNISNTNELIFTNITNKTINYIGVCDAATNGNLLFVIPLSSPVIIGSVTKSYVIRANGLVVLIDSVDSTIIDNIDGGLANTSTFTSTITG